jgi:hypothetical protein
VTFKTDLIVFIGIKRPNMTSHWPIFTSIRLALDTDNIIQWDQKENVKFTDIYT